MKSFGFWIVPENDVYQELDALIKQYSNEYDAPVFMPHMTIHGPVSSTEKKVVKDVKRSVSNIKPFKIQIGDVEFSTTYFQCVFVRMRTSAHMLDTHLALKKGLGYTDSHVFMPHVSLVYGEFNMSTREKIASKVKLRSTHFIARKIIIARADSRDPKDWEIVEQVSLE